MTWLSQSHTCQYLCKSWRHDQLDLIFKPLIFAHAGGNHFEVHHGTHNHLPTPQFPPYWPCSSLVKVWGNEPKHEFVGGIVPPGTCGHYWEVIVSAMVHLKVVSTSVCKNKRIKNQIKSIVSGLGIDIGGSAETTSRHISLERYFEGLS